MDENRVSGTVRNAGGKAQEAYGKTVGDSKAQVEGLMNQVSGAAQDLYGQARDTAADAAVATRDKASSLERILRDTIEDQPYTSVAIALGLGWLLGRMHRPL